MSKDPAILFYTSDFLTGTMFFTMAEKGEYITLLCIQHQQGRLSKEDFFSICSENSKVLTKFKIDENGLYYNEVLEEIIEKRKKFSDSRRNNRLGKNKQESSDNDMNKTIDSGLNHMENENVNVNEIVDHLNNSTGQKYRQNSRKTKSLIGARFNEGFSVKDFKIVIDKKSGEWKDTDMAKYLRPETLFGPKFESYLNQPAIKSEGDRLSEIYQVNQ